MVFYTKLIPTMVEIIIKQDFLSLMEKSMILKIKEILKGYQFQIFQDKMVHSQM
ncbi:hypothetical protein CLOSTHATH_00507 [Hungatella hathewayi DSM 13479]|uniref:Uncharacterized protein n=1 Tax=Hungatella hathewayi DSM 13479 TaxID=566550 RepID=D3AA86_9FIRM|nr:hypothetical protein CLOSTHATH_00507 [Hungatella hathewayi DSM 13479]